MWSKEYSLDDLGRIVQESIAQQDGLSAQTDYQYDGLGRITQLSDGENTQGFDYDKVGRLVQQRQYRLNANGMVESQALHYHYDKNGNRTKLTLPNKDEIHSLYYGSGHLSAIKYNNSLITEISRGKLHQELTRTQGKLTTQFKRDPLGRLAQQLAVLSDVNQPTSGQIVERIYQYDNVGNLIQTQDKRFGTTNYRYDKFGQIQLAGQELFRFDPAHNIIEQEQQKIADNRVSAYQGITYRYDEFGNLSQRTLPNGEVQSYRYNAKDKLVEVTIQRPNQAIETWQYQYDVLGRRISKVRSENGEILANTQKQFIWDGSHLVQEIDHKTNRTYCYIYSYPNSYEPLAQLHFAKNSKNPTACYYYHNDQIGVPRELTDEQGKLCWYANYSGWGKIKEEYDLTEDKSIHQPFRLQNQYCDSETGLHYNFFRYYEPNIGRFTQLDPIGLLGGENLYGFAKNTQKWTDSLGLTPYFIFGYSAEEIQNMGAREIGYNEANKIDQAAKQQAYEEIMQAYENFDGSIGISGDGSIAAMTKNKISVQAALTKNKGRMHPDACVSITQCNGIGIGGGGKLSAQGTISSSGTKSGQSVSICESGEAVTPYGGVAGSMCVNNSNETTFSGGLAVGGNAGIGVDVCNTYTRCIFD